MGRTRHFEPAPGGCGSSPNSLVDHFNAILWMPNCIMLVVGRHDHDLFEFAF
jgi:hypothetical protein